MFVRCVNWDNPHVIKRQIFLFNPNFPFKLFNEYTNWYVKSSKQTFYLNTKNSYVTNVLEKSRKAVLPKACLIASLNSVGIIKHGFIEWIWIALSWMENLTSFNIRTFFLCICMYLDSFNPFPSKISYHLLCDRLLTQPHSCGKSLIYSRYCHKLVWYSRCYAKYVCVICRNVINHNYIKQL